MVLMAFLCGCAASVALWRFWTPLCNEACPSWLALSMMAFSLALPLLCAWTTALVAPPRHDRSRRWLVPVLVVLVSGAAFAWLTQATR